MRITIFIVTIFVLCIPVVGEDKVSSRETQRGMDEAAMQRLEKTETEMRQVLDALEAKAQCKTDVIEKLSKAQTTWERYRDLHLAAHWPSSDLNSYGSAYPMCFAEIKRKLTESRIRELREMLNFVEGDVHCCVAGVKRSNKSVQRIA